MNENRHTGEDISQDDLFEMSNLSPAATGLAYRIWIRVNVHQRPWRPRMYVEEPKRTFYPLSIDDPVEFLADQPPGMSPAQFRDLQSFVGLNREALLAHWNDQIDTKDAFDRIRPI